MGRSGLAVAIAATATAATLAVPGGADAAGSLGPGATLTIVGQGRGSGVGLSQAGANRAAREGLDFRDIDDFYFPHTAWGRARGTVSIRLSHATHSLVEVHQRPHLVARRVGTARTWDLASLQPTATRWRIWPSTGGHSVLQYRVDGWHDLTTVAGDLQFSARGEPIRLYGADRASRLYRGILRSDPQHDATVEVVRLDDYVRGVLPLQLPSTWRRSALLRAQAVATRGYAAYVRSTSHGYYELSDADPLVPYAGVGAETGATDAAILATAHRVLTYAGAPAKTVWTRSNAGLVRAGHRPYLVRRTDPYDPTAGTRWKAAVAEDSVEARWPSAGPLASVAHTLDSTGKHLGTVAIHGQVRDYEVTADRFASWAQLPSPWFSITGVVAAPDPGDNVDPPASPRIYYQQVDVAGDDDLAWPEADTAGTLELSRGVADHTPDIDHYVVTAGGPGGSLPATSVQSSWTFTPGSPGRYLVDVYAVDGQGRMSLPAQVSINVP